MASNKGTLMELGISPIITSGMVIQLIQGAKLIHVDTRVAEDRALLKASTKFFAILLTFTQAFLYVFSGAYSSVADLGLIKASLIVLQLSTAGILLILLDEMLAKGYGLSQGGISLFIAVGVAETIIWKSFSPMTLNTGRGAEFEGAIVAAFHMLLVRPDKVRALREAFFRANLPNLSNVLVTVVVFVVVVFLQGYKKVVQMKNVNARGQTVPFEIKLFQTQSIPVILQAALLQNINLVSEVLFRKFETNPLVRLLGRWAVDERTGHMQPVGGLAALLRSPDSLWDAFSDPASFVHFLFYLTFVSVCCGLFARTWVEISGQSPREIAKMYRDAGFVLKDNKESIVSLMSRLIPTSAAFGGGFIGALTVIADLAGALGTGTGLLLASSIYINIYEDYKKHAEDREKGE